MKPVFVKYKAKGSQVKNIILHNAGVDFIHSTAYLNRGDISKEETYIANTRLIKIHRTLH